MRPSHHRTAGCRHLCRVPWPALVLAGLVACVTGDDDDTTDGDDDTTAGALAVEIEPAEPISSDDLVAVVTGDGDEAAPEDSYALRWFRDDEPQPDLDDVATVSADRTSRGEVWRVVATATAGSPEDEDQVSVANAPPSLVDPGTLSLGEGDQQGFVLSYEDADGDPVALMLRDLPRYGWFDPPTATLFLWPVDGDAGPATAAVYLTDDIEVVRVPLAIDVADQMTPEPPVLESTGPSGNSGSIYWYSHHGDPWMMSPSMPDEPFEFAVVVPPGYDGSTPLPLRLRLHGADGQPTPVPTEDVIDLWPHDHVPDTVCDHCDTFWFGYSDAFPAGDPTDGVVQRFTEVRVLFTLDFVLDNFAVDPERVFVEGRSMGGKGALTLGLRYSPRFAGITASAAAMDRRLREDPLFFKSEWLWGTVADEVPTVDGTPVWEYQAVGPWLETHPPRADCWISLHHGKDDQIVEFAMVAGPSPETGRALFESLEQSHAGHLAAWDGAAHFPYEPDPNLGTSWWGVWDPILDDTTGLRRDLSFPAFTGYSYQPGFSDPGSGNGSFGVDGDQDDNTYDGDRYGIRNRHLRWESGTIEDEVDHWSADLWIHDVDDAVDPPTVNHPEPGDDYVGSGSETVSVTPRRTQQFWLFPGEEVSWETSDGQAGQAMADDWGLVTVEQIEVGTTPTRLTVTRTQTPGE